MFHKRKISYCVKASSGQLHAEGSFPATRAEAAEGNYTPRPPERVRGELFTPLTKTYHGSRKTGHSPNPVSEAWWSF